MKRILQNLLLITVAALSVLPLEAAMPYFRVDGLCYRKIANDKAALTNRVSSRGTISYTGTVNIPETVTYSDVTYTVTAIDNNTFATSSIEGQIVLPKTITSIGSQAFKGCSALTGSLVIPKAVTSIGEGAFNGCFGFDQVIVENGNETFDSRGNCNAIIETASNTLTFGFACSHIPSTITAIAPSAFSGCSALSGSLTIPNSVTSIGDNAFNGCTGLNGNLTIGDAVTTIGNGAFSGCSGLSGSLTIPNSVTTIGDNAFNGCTGFTGNLALGNSVTTIGNSAFVECYGFSGDLTIPNSVTAIGESAFRGCTGFTGNLTIGNSVTAIGAAAFYDCMRFNGKLIMGNSVTSIGSLAFHLCPGFTGVYIADLSAWLNINFTDIYSHPLIYARHLYVNDVELTKITLPAGITEIKPCVFAGCSYITGSLVIPNTITAIGANAFYECSGLTGTLTIPGAVTKIGAGAFHGCSGFTGSITIPNQVTTIESGIFYGCSGFNGSLTLGEAVTSIGMEAFYGCSGLTGDLIIPSTVTQIGNSNNWNNQEGAFEGCSAFDGRLILGNAVKIIGSDAFNGCGSISGKLLIPQSVQHIGANAFAGCVGFDQMEVESGNEFYDSRGGCNAIIETKTNSIIAGCSSTSIPNDVAIIADYAFAGCAALTGDLIIPNSVTTIGQHAFDGCSGYDGTLSLGRALTKIGTEAFKGTKFNALYWNVVEYADTRHLLPETIKQLTIGDNVKVIPPYFFSGSQLAGSIVIPDSVVSIGQNAFYGCLDLNGSLSIGKSVSDIATGAFQYTNLEGVTVSADNTTFDSRGNCNAIIHTASSTLLKAFKNTVIPTTVKAVGEWAYAFLEADFAALTLPASVTTINDYAFVYCTGLTGKVEIPASVAKIGDCAFYGCENVVELSSRVANPAQIDMGCLAFECMDFNGCTLRVPQGSIAKYRQAEQWNEFNNISEQGLLAQGDVDGDGQVDVSDVNSIINIIFQITDKYPGNADINGDNKVDVSDINDTINIILDRQNATGQRHHKADEESSNRKKMEMMNEKVNIMLNKLQMQKLGSNVLMH